MKTCCSCRWASWSDEKRMHCALRGLLVARGFTCKRFEYEPGGGGMNCLPASLYDRAASSEQAWALFDGVKAMPPAFGDRIMGRFEAKTGTASIDYLSGAVKDLSGAALGLSSSDSEICAFAKERASEVRSLLMACPMTSTADAFALLAGYCQEHGATVPGRVLLAGLTARMTDAAWWRRQIRRSMARQVEAHSIALGFVHRRAGLYASDEAVKRHGEQQARNRAALEATEATNEEGLTMTLADLSAVGVSNPRIRRGELMTRIAGFEGFAKGAGHVGMFYTATAPSRMHPRFASSGQENPKFDGTTPRQCAGYMSKIWAKARAWMHRRGIHIYGFRVAEPHHDGTVHWHMLFFMLPQVVASVTKCLKDYFEETDIAELDSEKAKNARFNAKVIDWARGSAAGYISKYIAKNIDGKRNDLTAVGQSLDEDYQNGDKYEVGESDEVAPRVLAWASTWGIRQFQQIGGPGVTVWRELRRLRTMEHQGDLFDTWSAADVGNWEEFTRRQGGIDIARADRPVQLHKEEPQEYADHNGEIRKPCTKYGEPVGAVLVGVSMNGIVTKTRLHTWEIHKGAGKAKKTEAAKPGPAEFVEGAVWVRRGVGFRLSGAKRPWSPVNNCTPSKDADGFEVGNFADQPEPPALPPEEVAKIKAEEVAAILAGIASKRKRGGFGQFPRLNFPTGQEASK